MSDIDLLVEQARAGNAKALNELLDAHRERLRLGIHLRQNPLLRGRFDPSDVIQEAYIDAARRVTDPDYDTSVPFFVWLRFLVQQQLFLLTRRHLGTQKRDAGREVGQHDDTTHASEVFAEQFVASQTSPSMRVHRWQMQQRMAELLEELDSESRELLMLRHYEQLSNVEAAAVLNLKPSTASSKYLRALSWMRQKIEAASESGH